MGEEVPLAAVLVVGLLLAAAGTVTAVVVRAAAQGRLARNAFAGIRTRATLRSDSSWQEGHAAARSAGDLTGSGLVVAGAALPFVRDAGWFVALRLLAGAWAVGWSLVAKVRADRAAA